MNIRRSQFGNPALGQVASFIISGAMNLPKRTSLVEFSWRFCVEHHFNLYVLSFLVLKIAFPVALGAALKEMSENLYIWTCN